MLSEEVVKFQLKTPSAVMSVTDSTPNFLARCSALGLSEQIQDELVVAGLDTISKFAFSSSHVPGQQDEQPFRDAMQAALTNPHSVGEAATLRRLLHESYAMTAAELKQTVDRCEDQGVKRLAQPERADRLRRQQDKLQGLAIRGNLEPSDRLVDVAVTMFEENRLGYIEPSACTSKSQEVLSKSKEDKHISIVDGSLRIKNPANKLEAELGTDLLLRYALTRRGLALDQANILEFSLHDAWVEKLMEVKHTSSPQGYAAVQYNQLLNADRRLCTKLAELTRAGVQMELEGLWMPCFPMQLSTRKFNCYFNLCLRLLLQQFSSLTEVALTDANHQGQFVACSVARFWSFLNTSRPCIVLWAFIEELQTSGDSKPLCKRAPPMLLQRMLQESSLC